MTNSIIGSFVNDPWFRRGNLVVKSSYASLQNGRYVEHDLGTKTYRRGFFIRPATDIEVSNAGLSEITEGVLALHTQFSIPFSDGKPVDYEIDGNIVSGVTLSSIVIWHGYSYRILKFGDWTEWDHRSYFLDRMSKEDIHA